MWNCPGQRWLTAIALAFAAAASPTCASAQMYIVPPDFSGPAVTGSEPGLGEPLPGATPAELSAHLLWTMRAGLNSAALQCQFSPTLMTVRNYNRLLHDHARELEKARTALTGYFQRVAGKGKPALTAFDLYNTRTYNSFTTMYGKPGFCWTAGRLDREAIGQPKGSLIDTARNRLRELRNSLVYAQDGIFAGRPAPIYVEPLTDPCIDKKGRRTKRCE